MQMQRPNGQMYVILISLTARATSQTDRPLGPPRDCLAPGRDGSHLSLSCTMHPLTRHVRIPSASHIAATDNPLSVYGPAERCSVCALVGLCECVEAHQANEGGAHRGCPDWGGQECVPQNRAVHHSRHDRDDAELAGVSVRRVRPGERSRVGLDP